MSEKYRLNTKTSLKSAVRMSHKLCRRCMENLKDCLLSGVDRVCGKTKGGPVRHNETWWCNDAVNIVKMT